MEVQRTTEKSREVKQDDSEAHWWVGLTEETNLTWKDHDLGSISIPSASHWEGLECRLIADSRGGGAGRHWWWRGGCYEFGRKTFRGSNFWVVFILTLLYPLSLCDKKGE
jgi:hypothetical protein